MNASLESATSRVRRLRGVAHKTAPATSSTPSAAVEKILREEIRNPVGPEFMAPPERP